jgi:hypothetical protein
MAETRANPITGQLEVKHPDLNLWVQAIAPLLIQGGWNVSLSDAQAALLTAISQDVDGLPDILAAIIAGNTALGTLNTQLGDIKDNELGDVKTQLANLLLSLPVKAEVTDIRNALTGATSVNALLSTISTTKFSDLATRLDTLSTAIASLQTELIKAIPSSSAIVNQVLTLANTEYVYTIPAGTKRLTFKCRGDAARSDVMADIRYSWISGKVAGGVAGIGTDSYDVLPYGAEETADQYFAVDRSLYLASSVANITLSIRRWS